jgi:hypothetical protein
MPLPLVLVPIIAPELAALGAAVFTAGAAAVYIGMASKTEEEDDYNLPTRNRQKPDDGFTYQGKADDPILKEPMVVSAETHADFWEDDMDYSESVIHENSRSVGLSNTRTDTDERCCKSCPPDGKVLPMLRRCSRWSEVTINYQTRICGTLYNPATQQIQEFKYSGVSFDGWKEALCQFWEAKARYDQFFDIHNEPKGWWKGLYSAIGQASRHQAVATVNQPLKVVWIFMQPISHEYFKKIFRDMPDIITRCVP